MYIIQIPMFLGKMLTIIEMEFKEQRFVVEKGIICLFMNL